MKTRKLIALLLVAVMVAAMFAGCKSTEPPEAANPDYDTKSLGHKDPKEYTFNDYTPSFGTDWNPHNWETSSDSDILDYLSSGLYDFKLNDDLSAELIPFMAAKDPEDVTGSLTAEQKAKYGLPEDATEGYAYQYTLREDLKFEDGTVINAQSFADSLKLLLEPARQNGRVAEEMSGDTPIAGAAGYFYQGQISYLTAGTETDVSNGFYFSMDNDNAWWGGSLQSALDGGYESYFINAAGENVIEKWDAYVQANGGYDAEGYARIADADADAFISDYTEIANAVGGGAEGEWKEFIFTRSDFSDAKYSDFDNVGIIVDSEYVMTYVYGKIVSPFNAKYYQTSTWLVHTELYESLSKMEGDLKTTTYMTTKESSISYGPYILASYEPDKEMLYTRNENWFGYNYKELDGCYQTDNIRIKMMDQVTALLAFKTGELDSVALTASDLVDFGTSEYRLVLPGQALLRFFYNLGLDELKVMDADDSANSNTVALTSKNFRLALSAAIDRNSFTKITNRVPAFAMMNDLYTYDYEGEMNDGAQYRYRHLDAAKQAILDVYDIKWGPGTDYATLDMAVDSVTGYDPEYAKELFTAAFEELSANADETGFDPSKPVFIKIGYTSQPLTAVGEALQAELNAKFAAAVEGTGFAGFQIELAVDEDPYDAVTVGRLPMSYGGIQGARQDPWGITKTFCDPTYSLFLGANIPVYTDMVTITTKFDGETESTLTKSLYDWYIALTEEFHGADHLVKADILSAMESYYLKEGYTTPLESNVTNYLHSIRISYPLDEADPIVGFGGTQYAQYTMDDSEWATYAGENKTDGELPYK